MKKQPKGILKKVSKEKKLNKSYRKNNKSKALSRSLNIDKIARLDSFIPRKNKNKKILRIIQSKIKLAKLKRKTNSLSKIKENRKNERKKNLLGKKRNISFSSERIVKEYNPKNCAREFKKVDSRKIMISKKKK